MKHTRGEWEAIFVGKDACCTPVLTIPELEGSGYKQKPAVNLTRSPSLPIQPQAAWIGEILSPGHGAEEVLQDWMGWKKNKDYMIDSQGSFNLGAPKL